MARFCIMAFPTDLLGVRLRNAWLKALYGYKRKHNEYINPSNRAVQYEEPKWGTDWTLISTHNGINSGLHTNQPNEEHDEAMMQLDLRDMDKEYTVEQIMHVLNFLFLRQKYVVHKRVPAPRIAYYGTHFKHGGLQVGCRFASFAKLDEIEKALEEHRKDMPNGEHPSPDGQGDPCYAGTPNNRAQADYNMVRRQVTQEAVLSVNRPGTIIYDDLTSDPVYITADELARATVTSTSDSTSSSIWWSL